ncbi:MAG: hypothetical protein ACOC1O_05505 [bacterium]
MIKTTEQIHDTESITIYDNNKKCFVRNDILADKKWISEDEIEELFILYSRYCETNLPTHMRDLNKKLHDIKMRMEK